MTRKEYKSLVDAANIGIINDNLNPISILSSTASELLSKIAKGELNMVELAKRELENRGQNIEGKWHGFYKEI